MTDRVQNAPLLQSRVSPFVRSSYAICGVVRRHVCRSMLCVDSQTESAAGVPFIVQPGRDYVMLLPVPLPWQC